MEPIHSLYAKLNRADEHFKTLVSEGKAFVASNPYRLVPEMNSDFTEYSVRIHFDRVPDFVAWAVWANDVLNNIREALDHLMFALQVVWSNQDPPPGAHQIQFPICSDPTFFKEFIRRRLRNKPPRAARAILESAQPYPGRDAPFGWFLRIHDPGKHQSVQLALNGIDTMRFRVRNASGAPAHVRIEVTDLEDGALVLWCKFDAPEPSVIVDFNMSVLVVLRQEERPWKGLTRILFDIRKEAGRITDELKVFL